MYLVKPASFAHTKTHNPENTVRSRVVSSEISFLSRFPDYEVVIGMEVHVQLTTNTKIFCACPNISTGVPNSAICPICTGHPGTLPVLNEDVLKCAVMVGLATHSTIHDGSYFARKHYFYPDLPKDYQITQSDLPICTDGYLEIPTEQGPKRIRIFRIHMEEDAGKNVHSALAQESYVDLNRAGTPLLEIVSMPDLSSGQEVKAYLKMLRTIVMYLGVCSGNMEEGAFRADTNISVRKKGAPLGTKVELKNINSFKFIGDAIEYEIERQITLIESGGRVQQETRLWDTKEHKTISMRSKEEAADYRYLREPDLPPLCVPDFYIQEIKKTLPELPEQRIERYRSYGLGDYEADVLVQDQELATYFDAAYKLGQSKTLINWVLRDIQALAKELKCSVMELVITPARLVGLVALLDQKKINTRSAREIFEHMITNPADPQDLMVTHNLAQVGSEEELERVVQEIIARSPGQVHDYRVNGKTKLWGYFVGQVMAQTKGTADPEVVNSLLKKHLTSN